MSYSINDKAVCYYIPDERRCPHCFLGRKVLITKIKKSSFRGEFVGICFSSKKKNKYSCLGIYIFGNKIDYDRIVSVL